MAKKDPSLPSMIVFDLDDTLWTPETFTLNDEPTIPVEGILEPTQQVGVVAMKVPRSSTTLQLYPGARRVLYELATDPKYDGVLLAVASSSLEPSYSYTCMEYLEILPGLTIMEMISYDEVGRSGHLSPDKRTHFKRLHEESGVPYDEMLFFDDCNWGDHCAIVSKAYGVVCQRTPMGLQYEEFLRGLEIYRQTKQAQSSPKTGGNESSST